MPRQRASPKKKTKSKPYPERVSKESPDLPITPELRVARQALSKRGISAQRSKQWSTQALLRATEGDSQDSWKGQLKPFISAMFGAGDPRCAVPDLPPMPVEVVPRFVPAEVLKEQVTPIAECRHCYKRAKSLTCLNLVPFQCANDPFKEHYA